MTVGVGSKRGAAASAEQPSSSSPGGDEDLLDLACGETIPGSPVHPSSDPAAARHDSLQGASATAGALPASKSKSTSSSVSYPS